MPPPKAPPKAAALILIGIIVLMSSAFWYLGRDPDLPAISSTPGETPKQKGGGPAKPPSPAIAFAPRQDDPSAPAKSTTPTASAPTGVIPDNTPVKDILQRLEAQAASGNVQAACRVGIEKLRCLRVAKVSEERFAADPGARADRELCRDISYEQARDAWKYMWQAAQGGSVPAMSMFVRDPGLSFTQPADSAEGWVVYRDNAQSLLNQAVQGGDVMALWYSWWTSATGISTGGERVFEKNPYAAVMYGNAVLPLVDERRRRMIQNLNARVTKDVPPDQAARAASEGAALRAKYYGASTPILPDVHDDNYLTPLACGK
jgi:hypothetical protein